MNFARRCVAGPGLFRLLLAAAVIVNHSVPVHLGPAAVYLFFTLSGYWVYRMWGKEYAHTRRPYATFVVSRVWRLLPVYWVTLLIYWCGDRVLPDPLRPRVIPTGGALVHFLLSHAFILGYAALPFRQKLLLPVWSLDIELQFYIAFPLLILLYAAARTRPWLRALPLLLALAGIAAFFARYATLDGQSGAWLPMYLGFFLVGVETARYDWKPSPRLACASLAAASALLIVCALLPGARSIFYGQNAGPLAGYNPHGNFALACLLAPYAMATVYCKPTQRTRLGRFDRDLGNVTYELYLLHWPLIGAMEHFTGKVHTAKQVPYLLAAWAVVGLLSWCVYRYLDRPLDGLRRGFVAARMASQ